MPERVYLCLKFVRFKDIDNWSVSHILGMNMGYNEKYPLVPIGEIITKSVKVVKIEDDTFYKQITLKTNGGGAVLRDKKQGKNIGTKKQYIVSAGQFIMSKIDARNGAFGVVSSDLNGAVVTADFPVFDVEKERMLPEYLALISSTASFVRFAQSCSRGTTNRQRIDINLFLLQKIPLPSLKEQQALVVSYKSKIERSEQSELQAIQEEQNIEDYLLTELGIERKDNKIAKSATTVMASSPQVECVVSKQQIVDHENTNPWRDEIKKEYKYLKFVRFKEVERWDVYNVETNVISRITKSKFPTFAIGDKFAFIQRRWDRKESDFKYVELGAIDPLNGIMDAVQMSTSKAPSRATQKIKTGDLIIGMTRPYLKRFAIVDKPYNDCVCSSGFQVIEPRNSYNLSFLYEYLKSKVAIEQFSLYMSGALYPAITNNDLKKIIIPLPPIDVQNKIVEHINRQKEQIKQLKQQAEDLRKEALGDFEKQIFE